MRNLLACIIAAAALPASACPPVQVDEARMAQLSEAIRFAPSELRARELNNELWQIWTTAPDTKAQALLDSGMAKRNVADFMGAIAEFDALVTYCPDYAEGYNQRAFAHYLAQDFAAALIDIDAALERSPAHTGALSGRALTLMGLGRMAEAQAQLREALEINPWLPERRLLTDPPGKDL